MKKYNEYHVPTFYEYTRLNEGVKSKVAAGLGGLMLAGGLNASAAKDPKSDDDYERPYNRTEQKVDTVGADYSKRELNKYNKERDFANYNDYVRYENDKTHKVPLPVYNFKKKQFTPPSFYTGRYKYKFNETDFFFRGSGNNYLNLTLDGWDETLGKFAFTPGTKQDRELNYANDTRLNGKVEVENPMLNFKILKRPGGAGVALNDELHIAVSIRNVDRFMSELKKYYVVTPIGNSAEGTDEDIFSDKNDVLEWFNIAPKPNMKSGLGYNGSGYTSKLIK